MRALFRKHTATIVVAFITAAVVAGPAGLYDSRGSRGSMAVARTTTDCPSPTVSNIPCIKYGWKDGPVPLPGTSTTIAALPLSRGKYVINAKLYVHNFLIYTPGSLSVDCQLVAGPNFDWAKDSIPPTNTDGVTRKLNSTMSLTVANTFRSAGTVELKCSSETVRGDPVVSAHFIKITAQRVGTLLRVNM